VIDRFVVAHKGDASPSSRYRLGPLIEVLAEPPTMVEAPPVFGASHTAELVAAGGRDRALVLQRVLPEPGLAGRIRDAYGAVVFDYDDALYASPPNVRGSRAEEVLRAARRLALRGSPSASGRRRELVELLRTVDLCVAGNPVLRDFATRLGAPAVVIPTTIEPVAEDPDRPEEPTVVWLGLPGSLRYLDGIRGALRKAQARTPFRLRIVCSAPWPDERLRPEFVRWSEAASREALLTATVGIAPLADTAWTRGKCASRCIQYGAHALPAVASPVGVTPEVVLHGRSGWLASSAEEWVEHLTAALRDPGRSHAMGLAAREHVAERFSPEIARRGWREALRTLRAAGGD
jgi:glycosyltransferase involved in cell wall biosynthesis